MKRKTQFQRLLMLAAGLLLPAVAKPVLTTGPADGAGPAIAASFDAASAFLNGAAMLAPLDHPVAAVAEPGPGDDLYKEGTAALDDHQWQTAVDKFGQLANLHGARADEALYWKAYAFNKEGNRTGALATLAGLKRDYPKSRWLNDARALELQVRQASGQQVQPQDQPDQNLKLLAINGLMNSDPDRAVPLLEKFIRGDQPVQLKERALFVLIQSGSPQAREAVAQIARGSSNPDLQKKALDDLALFGGKQSQQLLADIYSSSGNVDIRRQILHDFMLSGDRDRLLAAAKSEKTPELRIDAIHQLGLVGAQDQLWQLYQQESSVNVKKEIIHAMFLGGNRVRIYDLARTERDPDLQREAIHSLGLLGAQDQLSQLYRQESSTDLKKEILHSLFLGGNRDKLDEIARSDPNPELRLEAIHDLGLLGAQDQLAQLYQQQTSVGVKKEILHSMFLGGNAQKLIEIARSETNPELRVEAIHSLGLMGGSKSGDALDSMYVRSMDAASRKAVVDALFIQGNAKALVEIARKETDPAMKQEIISKLALMKSKDATDYMMEILSH